MTASERFSCTPASLQRGEPLAGTATHVRTWLLLEHSGAWGDKALRDARLPEGLGVALQQLAGRHTAKVLLIRRPRASREAGRINVFAAYSDPSRPRLEHGTVADAREVLDLDLGALRTGGSTGLDAASGPIFCVCTNGRHDACCAEFGRPAALGLDAAHPELTWEVSHIGGDRFAGNLVVLPHGLYYGRLDAESVVTVSEAHLSGALDLDYLRGNSCYPMPVQAAEIELRRKLGLTDLTALTLQSRQVEDDVTSASFDTPDGRYLVRVRTTVDPATATRLTCKALRDNPVPRHDVLSIDGIQ
ncbi:MAG TPA: sucrase ferredoxin [Aeromicrobium sp.]|nr:sucrase ferredoxin [Aeromicrobium sp.]